MKTKTLFLLPTLMAGLGLMLAGRVTAQTFTTLYHFTATPPGLSTNSDGANPVAGLILSGNTLYGTAGGGRWGNGTLFKVNTDGTGFTVLHNFTLTSSSRLTNSDGCYPRAGLILSGSTLYGTANQGGSLGNGTVFKVNTDGTGFMTLHSFACCGQSEGGFPKAGLILSGNTLYGTASVGGDVFDGAFGYGTVFAVNTDGTGFTYLHSFNRNSDGASPNGVILSGNTLYGTAIGGGSSGGGGTVFRVNTNGTGFTNLHSFNYSDGGEPYGDLVLSGNTLYGTASYAGSSDNGTVFAVNTDGTGFTTLHSFTATSGSFSSYPTNSDGADPRGGLILSGNTLHGTASRGGSSGHGTVFAVNTDGGGFTNLHSFTETFDSYANSDGTDPFAGLILSGNTLYGTAAGGGRYGGGTVFSLSFTPQLTVVVPSGANLVLTWPTNVAGFDYTGYTLQSATNLVSPSVWTTVSPGPVVVNGQNAVTNLSSGSQHFFRLSQ